MWQDYQDIAIEVRAISKMTLELQKMLLQVKHNPQSLQNFIQCKNGTQNLDICNE